MRKKKSYRIFLIALMTLSIASGLSSCIDEDMSKCGKDYKIKYNLILNTQIHTLIDIDLNTTEERHIANRLKQELGTVFTDHALDNDLSFFIRNDLYRHEANIMNANSVSYTIYLPQNDYQNLSLANTGSARNVKITGANACKALALEQEQKDTIDSHNIGLFTSRLTIRPADHPLYGKLCRSGSHQPARSETCRALGIRRRNGNPLSRKRQHFLNIPKHHRESQANQRSLNSLSPDSRCALCRKFPIQQGRVALPHHRQGKRQIYRNHSHAERTAESRKAETDQGKTQTRRFAGCYQYIRRSKRETRLETRRKPRH